MMSIISHILADVNYCACLGSVVAHSVLLRDVQRVDCGGAAARGASAHAAWNK